MKYLATPIVLLAVLVFSTNIFGQQKFETKVLTANLKNPCGIAIKPVTGELFISDTGRGRVVQLANDAIEEVVIDFPIEEFELDSEFILGPLGLLFRGPEILMVGTGGSEDGADAISLFNLEQKGREPLKAEEAIKNLLLEANGGQVAEGDFFSMTRTRKNLFVTCNGESNSGWVANAELVVKDVKELRRFIPTNKLTKTAGPGGITMSPDGHVVVAQMGSRSKLGDSVIGFYSQAGELLDKFPTGLNDIVALGYGPQRKRLFALDFSWGNPKKGGLYKLVAVDNSKGCEAVLIANLERPTAMTFDQRGNVYVTCCGFAVADNGDPNEDFLAPGKVVKVIGVD